MVEGDATQCILGFLRRAYRRVYLPVVDLIPEDCSERLQSGACIGGLKLDGPSSRLLVREVGVASKARDANI